MKSLLAATTFAACASAAQALPPVLGPASATTNVAAGGIVGPDGGYGRATTFYNPNGGQQNSGAGSRSVDGSCPQLPSCPSSAATNVAYGPLPSVAASATSGVNGTVPDGWILPYNSGVGSFASATMQYQFSVYGPANTTAYVDVDALMRVSGGAYVGQLALGSGAGFSVAGPSGVWIGTQLAGLTTGTVLERTTRDLLGNATSTNQPSFNQYAEHEVVPFTANSVYTISLQAYASAISTVVSGPNLTNGASLGYIDPQFTIDPSTPNAAAYSLLFSAGIGNAAPVPEPSMPALAGFGLGVLAVWGRRRRATAA